MNELTSALSWFEVPFKLEGTKFTGPSSGYVFQTKQSKQAKYFKERDQHYETQGISCPIQRKWEMLRESSALSSSRFRQQDDH